MYTRFSLHVQRELGEKGVNLHPRAIKLTKKNIVFICTRSGVIQV